MIKKTQAKLKSLSSKNHHSRIPFNKRLGVIFLLSEKFKSSSTVKALIFGLIVSLISSLVFVVIGAIAATNIEITDEGILILSLICMGLGTFSGGWTSAKFLKEKGWFIGMLNGLIFFLITTIISFITNPEPMTLISVIKLLIFVITSLVGGVLGVNITRKRSF